MALATSSEVFEARPVRSEMAVSGLARHAPLSDPPTTAGPGRRSARDAVACSSSVAVSPTASVARNGSRTPAIWSAAQIRRLARRHDGHAEVGLELGDGVERAEASRAHQHGIGPATYVSRASRKATSGGCNPTCATVVLPCRPARRQDAVVDPVDTAARRSHERLVRLLALLISSGTA